ncbi:MAG: nickel-binding protein [Gaiellaceae bacterium]|jgi:quinol monooxygenase YgiN
MTMFLVERQFHVGQDEMEAVGKKSRRLIEESFPEITWHHTHVVVDDEAKVRTYCVYEAPTAEDVRNHSQALGLHDITYIGEIAGDVTPEDFPL